MAEFKKVDVCKLHEQYQSKINLKEITAQELIDLVTTSLPASKLALQDIPKEIVSSIRYNASLLAGAPQEPDMQLLAFQLLQCDASKQYYYEHPFKPIPVNGRTDVVFFVLETLTMSIFSNSDRLFLNLFLEKGIAACEQESMSNKYINYLLCLQRYYSC